MERSPTPGSTPGRTPLKRPWYLLVAIIFAWLFGVGGCTGGTTIIGSYWSPAPDPTTVASHAQNEDDRKALAEAAGRCFVATERAKPRIFPIGVASLVLGIAIVMLAARAMAGRSTARNLLIQVLLAQAAFVLVRDFSTRDVMRECLDFQRMDLHVRLVEQKQDPAVLDQLTPELRLRIMLAGSVLHACAAGLIVLALRSRRTREYYAAMERMRHGGA